MRNSKDLFLVIIYLFIGSALFTTSSCQTTNTTAGSDLQHASVEGLFGQVAKTFVYGVSSLARFNNRLLCPLLRRETDRDNQDQPTLLVFNNQQQQQRAFKIYSDDEITPWMIEVAQFNPSQMTIIFVHGWLGGIHNELWLNLAKSAILSVSNQNNNRMQQEHQIFAPNVIVVEWSDFAHGSLYTATQNSLKVSRRLGLLLKQLAQVGNLKPELMHCLGHSIGAHICGQAARLAFPPKPKPIVPGSSSPGGLPAPSRLGRITGLDPGGFCYELGIRNETRYAGLRPSDALVVDAYYSNRSPFGNKYKVGQYNVRINNGFFQKPCSVWKNSSIAIEYFRAAVRFTLGNTAHNDILSCDHYFATRFAYLNPSLSWSTVQSSLINNSSDSNLKWLMNGIGGLPTCSYMAYACRSYRNFMRGQCGLCESREQCYSMDFEYQKLNSASTENALSHLKNYSSYLHDFNADEDSQDPITQLGGVQYGNRRVYYMRITNEEPFCSVGYRLRVNLNQNIVDIGAFKNTWLELKFYSKDGDLLAVKDVLNEKVGDTVQLNGPWVMNAEDQEFSGVQENTLTAMLEMPPISGNGLLQYNQIDKVKVYYDNRLDSRQMPLANPIESIMLDYLSSPDESIRKQNSRSFAQGEFKIVYKHLEVNVNN